MPPVEGSFYRFGAEMVEGKADTTYTIRLTNPSTRRLIIMSVEKIV